MISTKGTQGFLAKLRADKSRLEGKVQQTHRNIVKAVLTDLVTNSPQWSGNLASNWYLEFHGITGAYNQLSGYKDFWATNLYRDEEGVPEVAYHMGMDPAVGKTLDRELKKLPLIKYNTVVNIVNKTPYAEDVEMNQGPNGRPIRPENMLASYGGVAMVGYVEMKYKNLGQLKKLIA